MLPGLHGQMQSPQPVALPICRMVQYKLTKHSQPLWASPVQVGAIASQVALPASISAITMNGKFESKPMDKSKLLLLPDLQLRQREFFPKRAASGGWL